MYDNSLYFSTLSEQKVNLMKRLDLEGNPFVLATLHRDSNTDDKTRLSAILDAIITLSHEVVVVLPMHPRTRKMVEGTMDDDRLFQLFHSNNIIITEPVSFLEMIQLEKNAKLIVTDSGGVQKEAFFFKKPCIILRPETEWVEIVKTGAATLADADKSAILEASMRYLDCPPTEFPNLFGDGHAASFILNRLLSNR